MGAPRVHDDLADAEVTLLLRTGARTSDTPSDALHRTALTGGTPWMPWRWPCGDAASRRTPASFTRGAQRDDTANVDDTELGNAPEYVLPVMWVLFYMKAALIAAAYILIFIQLND
jgi:hypothetical protein